jgi:hypothetical protein
MSTSRGPVGEIPNVKAARDARTVSGLIRRAFGSADFRRFMRPATGGLSLVMLTLYVCAAISPSRAAEIIRLGEYPYMFAKIPHFLLKGQIVAGDVSKVKQAIHVDPNLDDGSNAVVSFDSPGGAMEEGIKIGEFLAESAVATVLRQGETCVSACALAFLGGRSFWPTGGVGFFLGRYLEPGARLGFHSTAFEGEELAALAARGQFTMPVEMTRVSLKTLADYLEKNGVSSSAIIEVMGTPNKEFKYISSANDLFNFNINMTPMRQENLNVREAIYSACEKMLAAKEKSRVGSSDVLQQDNYRVHDVGKDDFLGFGLNDIIYIQFVCGIHLTQDESRQYRARRIDLSALENTVADKIRRLNQSGESSVEIEVIATDDGGQSYRDVVKLRIKSGPWSILTPTSAGVQGFTSYYPLAYWLVPGNVPIESLKPVSDDWSKK